MNSNIKTIVIYSGGFQPFGLHHFKNYELLCRLFGKNNVYICTSNHVTDERPLTFSEKEQCIMQYGISKNKIFQVKNNYNAVELLKFFDHHNTAIIYSFGEKDKGRFKFTSDSYFQEYYMQPNLNPLSKNGYVFELPMVSVKYNGVDISGTTMRKIIPNTTPEEFKKLMGWFEPNLYSLLRDKFKDKIKSFVESVMINESLYITDSDLRQIERYADQLFNEFGIDINFQSLADTHFLYRVNDPRNKPRITFDELKQLFKKASIKYGEKLSNQNDRAEGVLKDMETDINMPFILKWDLKYNELDLVPKTIMRKSNFLSNTPIFAMESVIRTRHIQHLYEDSNLKIKDLIDIFKNICNGMLKGSIKYDGQNLKCSFKNNEFVVSRNKSTIVNPMNRSQFLLFLRNKPENVISAFIEAFDYMKLALRDVDKTIFQNGKVFLNFEILNPKTINVFYYGPKPKYVIHNLLEFDEVGNEVKCGVSKFIDDPNIIYSEWNNFASCPEVFMDILNELDIYNSEMNINPNLKPQILKWSNWIIQKNSMPDQFGNLGRIKSELLDFKNDSSCKEQFELLNYLGGLNSINSIEGIVFNYNGTQYKLTGSFAPVNQILATNKYNRGK